MHVVYFLLLGFASCFGFLVFVISFSVSVVLVLGFAFGFGFGLALMVLGVFLLFLLRFVVFLVVVRDWVSE